MPHRSPPRHVKRRRMLLAIGASIVLAGLILGALSTGVPQRAVLQWLLSRHTGALAEVENVRLLPSVSIPRILLRDPGTSPALALEGLDIAYRWRPMDGRWVDQLSLSRLALTLDNRIPAQTNFNFIRQLLAQPASTTDLTPFLPRTIRLGTLFVEAQWPDWSMRLDSLGIAANVVSLQDFSMTLEGQPAHLLWSAGGQESPRRELTGSIRLVLTRNPEELRARAEMDLPELAKANGSIWLKTSRDRQELDVDFPEVVLQTRIWPDLASALLPVPVQFEKLQLTDVHAHGDWTSGVPDLSELRWAAAVNGLCVGDTDQPLYHGAVAWSGQGGMGGGRTVESTVVFADGQIIVFVLEGVPKEPVVTASFKDWPREHLTALAPAAFRPVFDRMPMLKSLSADAKIHCTPPRYAVSAQLQPQLAGGSLDFFLQGDGDLEGPAGPWFQSTIKTGFDNSGLEITSAISMARSANVEVLLKEILPDQWWKRIYGTDFPWPLSLVLDGSVSLDAPKGEPWPWQSSATIRNLAYQERRLPENEPLKWTSSGRITADAAGVDNVNIQIQSGEQLRVDVQSARMSFSPTRFAAVCDGAADLEWVGACTGLNDLYGNVSFHAPMEFQGTTLNTTLELTAETLGYGSRAIPYGNVLKLAAKLHADTASGQVVSPLVEAKLGTTTLLSAEQCVLEWLENLSGWRLSSSSLRVHTNLEPFVSMGYLESADGSADIQATGLSYQPGQSAGSVAFGLNATRLALPGGLADFSQLQVKGTLEDLEALNGTGELLADSLKVVQASLTKLAITLTVHQGVAVLEFRDAVLFDGTVSLRSEIQLRDARFPLRVSGTLHNIDLAAFSREVKPPAVILGGRASGAFEGYGDWTGVQELKANLDCSEGFSINRDVVERLALYTQGIAIIGKSLQKAIGDEDPRRFDKAELTLGYQAGNTTVSVRVTSRLLDLAPVFYIKADLLDLLRLMKEDELQNIQGLDYSTP